MTKISLFTKDQVLMTTHKVKIASGDIDSVTLEVTFDEKWDAFTSKTAIFDNSNYTESIPDRLLVDGRCVVPWEALSVAGALTIGIVGDAVDGRKKTSTLAKLNILPGAKLGTTTVSPSLDLYQQYIDAMANLCDPVSLRFNALMDEHDETFQQRMEELDTYMQGELVWENSNPTSAYGGGGFSGKDLSKYVRVEVVVYENTDAAVVTRTYARVGETVRVYGKQVGGNAIQESRTCEVRSDGISFGQSYSNYEAIPFRVYGYKY